MSRVRRFLVVAGMNVCACAPLTYSDGGAVDFEKDASVRASVASSLDSLGATHYFAEELRAESGFTYVTVDPTEVVDAVLDVYVSVTPQTVTNDDGSVEIDYSSEASYRLSAPGDSNIDSGTTNDRSESEWEAIEDALDQVAAHYVRPYRL
jgi:hypothetical protein